MGCVTIEDDVLEGYWFNEGMSERIFRTILQQTCLSIDQLYGWRDT